MISKKYLLLSTIAASMITACNSGSSGSAVQPPPNNPAQTAPALPMKFQARYEKNGQYDPNSFLTVQNDFFIVGQALRDGNLDKQVEQNHHLSLSNLHNASTPVWNIAQIYSEPGNKVLFTNGTQTGVFVNSWWTLGDTPDFTPNYGNPWRLVQQVVSESDITKVSILPTWNNNGQYTSGYILTYNSQCYKAQWWNQGSQPPQTAPAQSWQSPWVIITCPSSPSDIESAVDDNRTGETDDIEDLPSQGESTTPIEDLDPIPESTPIIPIEVPESTPSPIVPPTPIIVESQLPSAGYKLLRSISDADWNWLFPLRYGKSNPQGGTYNNDPYTTNPGDIFTLASFKKAVLEYNAYAARNNYKQFLNDGNQKQQAEEFAAFMSNVSRETSGSWQNAPAPWIAENIWKGGLYWVQEVGYSTNSDGTSPFVGYVDAGSDWAPVQGRSYHGRGPIQLSWNYNYGAFSAWLYDNGLYSEKIKSRNALLINPGLVNSDPVVSLLSAIWFWMTPQGPKPSAHDVIYGAVSNISRTTQETGLPPMKDGSTPPNAVGDSVDPEVIAYRLGTTINIINGGIECNGAASWHPGPPQRASYYNAYAAYINSQYNAGATLIPAATNIWNDKISTSSPRSKQSATCFNQKSYYGY